MNKSSWLIYFLVCCLLTACGKKSVSTRSGPVASELSIEEINFNYLTSSGKIRYSNEDQNVSATANIRIKKDSVIWISITPGFGIEAARGLITRDSITFINRLEKEYHAYSFQELSNKFNFSMSYDLLQSVLVGDMLRALSPSDQVRKQADHFLVRQQEGPLTIDNFIDARLMKVDRVTVVDETNREAQRGRSKNTLTLQYENFEKLDDQWLPFKNVVSLDYQSKGQKRRAQVDIQYKKINIIKEALRFPFSIPDKYARK